MMKVCLLLRVSTRSLRLPIEVTLTSNDDCGPSGAFFDGSERYRASRASVTDFSSGKQSQTAMAGFLWTGQGGATFCAAMFRPVALFPALSTVVRVGDPLTTTARLGSRLRGGPN